MTNKPKDKPKIIVDDDWKAEAQAEKQRLAEELESGDKKKGAKPDSQGTAPEDMPPLDFVGLVNTLGMQAMMGMGGMEDPETKKRMLNLGLSKFNIDALAIIKEKSQGNLTDEEKTMLEKLLYELQMTFINVSKQVSKMMKEQQEKAPAGETDETPEKFADAPKPKIEEG